MKIKINKNFSGHKAGDIVNIESQGDVPIENFWRRRLRDSAIDGCCEIVIETKKKKTTKEVDTNGE